VHDRISVTLPLLTRAKRAFFLVTGPKKAALLAEMERSKAGIMRYPALAFPGDTVWILG
jgi:6-phosphogluconolactonase/glucosamine-6-phosphate isomerase/deaminase